AEWCPPCRLIEPTVAALADEYAGQVRVGKMDMDDNSAVPQRYGIRGIPTLILFKNGKEEERMVGAASKEAIRRMIDKHASVTAAA
ncbi:MAG TPA: thioredoxin domain-containing protein, partial [Pyrinomonadaceae bacterium]